MKLQSSLNVSEESKLCVKKKRGIELQSDIIPIDEHSKDLAKHLQSVDMGHGESDDDSEEAVL